MTTATDVRILEAVTNTFLQMTQTCPGWTELDDEDGTESNFTLGALSFPKFGDQTIAVRVSGEPSLIGIPQFDYVVMRRGNIINVIGYAEIDFDGVDSSQTEKYAQLTDQRVEQID